MKRTILAGLALAGAATLPSAQLRDLPRASPRAATMQYVGVTELRVDYHRPAVRGREIWGSLVPYGQVWRAGANETTALTVSDPIRIEGQEIPAGRYGLLAIPGKETWTVIFTHASDGWGASGYDRQQDALRVEVTPVAGPHAESLSYSFEELTENSATLRLRWEKLVVPVRLEVDTTVLTLGRIEKQLLLNPEPRTYLAAAEFSLTNGLAQEKGLVWVDQALKSGQSFQALAIKAGLLHATGQPVDADGALQQALGLAPTPDQLARYARRFQRLEQHALALPLLYGVVDARPEAGWAWAALGDCLAASGFGPEALECYRTALPLMEDTHEAARVREASAELEQASGG